MNDVHYVEIDLEENGQRLDNYLLRVLKGVPKSHIYRIIRSGEVRLNKKRTKPGARLSQGDWVRIPPVRLAQETTTNVGSWWADVLKKSVIYEDEQLLVMNKPAGIAVHGGSGLSLGLIEALRSIRVDLPYLELVHRLDRETSGCLLLAKKRSMLRAIQGLLEARLVDKTYWALLTHSWHGTSSLTVDVALQKNTLKSGERMVRVSPEGKSSQTAFKLLENYSSACWVEVKPKTGRTHQIRVHSAHLGHAIVGDQKYGQTTSSPMMGLGQRLYLHARAIQFNLNGRTYSFEADLDQPFSSALKKLRKAL